MSKITPFLWFDDRAEEAMNFYTSIFKNSKVVASAAMAMPGRDRREPSCWLHFNPKDKDLWR